MANNQNNSDNSKKYYIYLLIMIVSGACNTIFIKLQNDSYEDILNEKFSHPWFQSFVMFIGESYCAILWFSMKKKLKQEEDDEKIAKGEEIDTRDEPPLYVFLITSSFDLLGTTCLNFALALMPASIFQMLRGGIVIVTTIFTIVFLKRKPKNFQWLGVGVVFLGVFLVGLSSQIESKSSDNNQTSYLGIFLVLFSLLFTGSQFVFQEKILSSYRVYPLQLVAWEGIFGSSLSLIFMIIFNFTPCPSSLSETCSKRGDSLTFEKPIFALEQVFDKVPMIFYVLGNTISIAFFNLFGILIVKYASSATRSVMDSARTILIWLFFLFVPVRGHTTDFYQLQLTGFIVLVIGQLIYNQLVTVNFFNFDEAIKEKILSESSPEKLIDEEEENKKNEYLLNTQTNNSNI